MPDPGCCAWCGDRLPSAKRRRFCCSAACAEQWELAGKGPSRAQVTARLQHLDQQPRGYETIEAFLAAGGQIYLATQDGTLYAFGFPIEH